MFQPWMFPQPLVGEMVWNHHFHPSKNGVVFRVPGRTYGRRSFLSPGVGIEMKEATAGGGCWTKDFSHIWNATKKYNNHCPRRLFFFWGGGNQHQLSQNKNQLKFTFQNNTHTHTHKTKGLYKKNNGNYWLSTSKTRNSCVFLVQPKRVCCGKNLHRTLWDKQPEVCMWVVWPILWPTFRKKNWRNCSRLSVPGFFRVFPVWA